MFNSPQAKRCDDHELRYLVRCPLCEDGVEPARITRAREDFRGVPLAGTVDILPHHTPVALEEVVRTVALQLAALERLQREIVAPVEAAKKAVYRTMREAQLDTKTFNRAVRCHLGLPGTEAFRTDPSVAAILELMGPNEGQQADRSGLSSEEP
jgi:hypothetical protein